MWLYFIFYVKLLLTTSFEGFVEPQSEGLSGPQPSNQRLLRASAAKQNLDSTSRISVGNPVLNEVSQKN